MTPHPQPVLFEPVLKPKPWGGRGLERRFGKALPPDTPIGESWELVSLPGDESRVRSGPLAGRTLSDLMGLWGPGALGGARPIDGRFPLLIKFLDARENLSIQVHPRPDGQAARRGAPVKHEAWYVVHAEPGAQLYIGTRPGVTLDDLRAAAGSPRLPELLRRWPARPGLSYYLPSGTPHALGGGILLAEVQTPSDVTYRLYDWGRVDERGRARELHVDEALANVRIDVPPDVIRPPRRHVGSVFSTSTRLVACEAFIIEKVRIVGGLSEALPYDELAVWIVLSGAGELGCTDGSCAFRPGDVVLIPAGVRNCSVRTAADCEWLDVRVPVPSTLRPFGHPEREARPPGPGDLVTLTRAPKSPQDDPPRPG